jgi:hypothetical protein
MNLPKDKFDTMYPLNNDCCIESPKSNLINDFKSLISFELINEGILLNSDFKKYISWLNYISQKLLRQLGYIANENLKIEDFCKGYIIKLTNTDLDLINEFWEIYHSKYYSNC